MASDHPFFKYIEAAPTTTRTEEIDKKMEDSHRKFEQEITSKIYLKDLDGSLFSSSIRGKFWLLELAQSDDQDE